MASLKKPASCSCGSIGLHKEKNPERWVCNDCSTIVRTRQKKPDRNSCRECGAERGTKPFKSGKNLCLDCDNIYMKKWREDNDAYKEYRNDLAVRNRLAGNVKRAIEKSPRSFLKYLLRNTKIAARNKAGKSGRSEVIGIVEIDFDYLISMWESQGGSCAISKLPMEHKMGSLHSLSIDRIDSGRGYVPGNVQLVCQWVNHAKRHHPNSEMVGIVNCLREGL